MGQVQSSLHFCDNQLLFLPHLLPSLLSLTSFPPPFSLVSQSSPLQKVEQACGLQTQYYQILSSKRWQIVREGSKQGRKERTTGMFFRERTCPFLPTKEMRNACAIEAFLKAGEKGLILGSEASESSREGVLWFQRGLTIYF